MSTPTSQVSGLVSGIDWDTTVAQLMQIERRRVTLIENRKTDNNTKLSLWSQIQAKVASLQSVAQGIDRRSEFAVKSASSSDSDIVSVSASASAAPGSHSVEVIGMAKAHRIASQGWNDSSSTGVGDSGGDFVIEINGETITIADADFSSATTLEQLRNLINASPDNGGKITASILNDGSETGAYRLVLAAGETGSDNEINITSNPTSLNFSTNAIDTAETESNWTGTSAITTSGTYSGSINKTFAFTIGGTGTQTVGSGAITVNWVDSLGTSGSISIPNGYGGTPIVVAEGVEVTFAAGDLVAGDEFRVDVFSPELTAAQDATIRVDGIYMSKASNSVTDVLDGVTLDLLSAAVGQEVSVTIANDEDGVKDKIQGFVNSYNSLMFDISTFTSYDDENEAAAPLLGDGFLSSIRSRFNTAAANPVSQLPDGAPYTSLAHIGIRSSSRGSLSVDSAALDEALENNFEEVVNLFTRTFDSEDGKIFLVDTSSDTHGGEYSLVVNYDASGAMTSATINGQSATVDGTLIYGATGTNLEGLTLGFTSPGTGPGQVNTTIRIGKGVADTFATEATQILDNETGTIHFAMDRLNQSNASIDSQIESWNKRLAITEQTLRRQFNNLETMLSRMKNQSNFLSGVLG